MNAFDPDAEWWVGLHSTNDGYTDPMAILLLGRAAARSWTLEPPDGETLNSHVEHAWSEASFSRGRERSDSFSVLAKVVMGRDFDVPRSLTEYRVEVTGTFVQGFSTSVFAPPGLSRRALEELIEASWGELSSGSHGLLESSWALESYAELPPSPPTRP